VNDAVDEQHVGVVCAAVAEYGLTLIGGGQDRAGPVKQGGQHGPGSGVAQVAHSGPGAGQLVTVTADFRRPQLGVVVQATQDGALRVRIGAGQWLPVQPGPHGDVCAGVGQRVG